jgi:hypothetical protein
MKSNEPSDRLPDLEWDVPTTPEDIRALRENQPTQGQDWWERFQQTVDQLPGVQEALRKRPTFEGCPPFEL